jgi:hypothetical protein
MDPSAKTRILSGLVQSLLQLATDKELAIVLTNHVTTRFKQNGDKSSVQPTLGEILGHSCYSRVLLEYTQGYRYATLLKSPSKRPAKAAFQLMVHANSSGTRRGKVMFSFSEGRRQRRAAASAA